MKIIIYILVFVLTLNAFLFMSNFAIQHIDPNSYFAENNFYNPYEYMQDYDKGTREYSIKDVSTTDLPSSESSWISAVENFFTDIYNSIKSWLINSIPGANILISMVNAIPNFLKSLGLPKEIAFALGYLWHGMTIFLLVAWWKGT